MIEKIKKELKSFTAPNSITVATVGMTSRDSAPFTVLPRRKTLGFETINFLISNIHSAEKCLNFLDGKVKYILIDVESKKNVDLESIAKKTIKSSIVKSYKPNDATVEAADLYMLNYFKDFLKDKKILIYGAGNIAGKLALRLAERGAEIYIYSRDKNKVSLLVNALNLILPRYSLNRIKQLQNFEEMSDFFDAIISFISSKQVINHNIIQSLKENALVLDGGINNFTHEFYKNSSKKRLNSFRLDVRLGFLYSLIPLMDYTEKFFREVQGKSSIEEIKLVSGGIIGNEGDIIVDSIKSPTQVIGIANGLGGTKEIGKYNLTDIKNLEMVQKYISEKK
ncbi:NAD(P)-binding domain-containing protein [Cytobacillus sp.]|uniref:NAD(P)-binding domain-containing protein n=1 Tax=Cytobacillus sp. TaxID=2675269 RepID=UPI003512E892